MSKIDWFEYLKSEGFFEEGFFQWPPAKEAAERLHAAQKRVQSLAQDLKEAGVKPEDKLTVSVFVETTSRIAEQESAETHFVAMGLMYHLRKIADKLG